MEADNDPDDFLNIITFSKMKSRAEAEAEVKSWGFDHVFTWSDGP